MFENKPLIVFEMANNHMGDMDHGLLIIDTFGKYVNEYPEFDFIFKFQFRDIPTFIHPDYKDRMDVKYVKRFSETALSKEQFARMFDRVRSFDMKVMTTPFDENSVDLAEELDVDIIKIASCSCCTVPYTIANGDSNRLLFSAPGILGGIPKNPNKINMLLHNWYP